MDNPLTIVFLFIAVVSTTALVAAAVGRAAARQEYLDLSARVASMEAAVAAYWDRIRKRMRVEPLPEVPKPITEMTEEEIISMARRQGLFDVPAER